MLQLTPWHLRPSPCLLPRYSFINPMVAAMHQAMTAPKLLTKLGCDESSKVPVVTLDHYWENVLRKQQVRGHRRSSTLAWHDLLGDDSTF